MKEETLHAQAGGFIINLIKKENPDWFTEDFYRNIEKACKKAYEAEEKIIEWIFEKGDIDFVSKQIVLEFTKDRFNQSMIMIGANALFEINKDILKHAEWFNIELNSETHTDFFHKTPTNYTKKQQSITIDDLF